MTEPMQKHAPSAEGRREPTHEEDQRLEIAIAMLLRIGVVIAAALVAIGGIMTLHHPESAVPNFRVFNTPAEASTIAPASSAIHSIAAVFHQLREGRGASIIALGLLVQIGRASCRERV